MRPEKKPQMAKIEDYTALGIREELVPILQKMGILTIEELKKYEVNKLFNDICGMRKKMKLDNVKNPTKEEVASWLS